MKKHPTMKDYRMIFRILVSLGVLGVILYYTVPYFGLHIKYILVAVFSTVIILGEIIYRIRKGRVSVEK